MKTELTLVVAGRLLGVPAYTVLTSEATKTIFERLATEGEHVVAYRNPEDEILTAPIQPGTVVLAELADGMLAVKAIVELPDDFETPAPATAKTGLELTEADRAAKMPGYEERAQARQEPEQA